MTKRRGYRDMKSSQNSERERCRTFRQRPIFIIPVYAVMQHQEAANNTYQKILHVAYASTKLRHIEITSLATNIYNVKK